MSSTAPSDSTFDIEFFWDPVCPFAWITSRWVAKVALQSNFRVDWRFISLRLLNKHKDYATEFPPEYEAGHTAGLRMLRVAAAVRADLGREPLGALVTAYGHSYWDQPKGSGMRARLSSPEHVREVLADAGLATSYATALDDTSWDQVLDDETELALSRTGRDVGTPIITFHPPNGVSFFGPVISRVPDDADALPLWQAVTTLAAFPGFAEMKRSLREVPQLNILGAPSDRPGPGGLEGRPPNRAPARRPQDGLRPSTHGVDRRRSRPASAVVRAVPHRLHESPTGGAWSCVRGLGSCPGSCSSRGTDG